MSDSPSTTGSTEAATTVDAPNGDDSGSSEKATKFEVITSQEALDRIIDKRLAREKARYESLEAEVAKSKDAPSTDDRIKALEAEVAASKAEALRATVAAEKGVPADILHGDTREDMETFADKVLALAQAKTKTGTHVPTEGRANTNTTDDPRRALARALFNRD